MNNINLEKLNGLGFKKVGINWLGKIGRYYFEIQDKQDSEEELIVSLNLAPNTEKSKLFEYLDNLENIKDYSKFENRISIIYEESEDETDDISTFLKGLCSNLEEVEGRCVCGNCENTEYLSYYTSGDSYTLLCEECGTKAIKNFEASKNANTNYVKGFIFSLVGAILGSALWIVLGAIGLYASIAGLFIAYCAFKGYEMAQGKFTRKGIILNVVAIVIAFILAQYAGLFLEFIKETPSLKGEPKLALQTFLLITPYMFTDIEFIKGLLPDLGLGLLFVTLGTYRMITNNYKAAKLAESIKIEKLEL